MAESTLAVTPGSGQLLRTNSRTIGGTAVHEQGVIIGEGNAATYTALVKDIAISTAAAHLLIIQGDGTNYVRLRRIKIHQSTAAGAAATAYFGVYRTTTAGTGGTVVDARPFDSADTNPYGGTVASAPTSKGTEGDQLLHMRVGLNSAANLTNIYMTEWVARDDNTKSILLGSAVTGGIAIKNETAVGTAKVDIEVEFVVTSYL